MLVSSGFVLHGNAYILRPFSSFRTLHIFTHGGTLLYTADVFGRPVSLCASQQLLVVLTQTGCSGGALQLHCSLMHIHPNPSGPTASFRLPISCLKRRLAAPPAAAASMPDIDILHEGGELFCCVFATRTPQTFRAKPQMPHCALVRSMDRSLRASICSCRLF